MARRVALLVAAALVLLWLAYAAGASLATYGDMYPRWYGLRALLLEGRNPYSAAVTAEATHDIPLLTGGPSTAQGESGEARAVQTAYGFLYPLPGALLLSPLALLPYRVVWALWMVAGVLALPSGVLAVYAWRLEQRLRDLPREAILCIPLAYVFLPSLWNLALAQPGLAVVALTALALRMSSAHPVASGAALAAAVLLKPQLVIPLAPLWMGYRAHRWWRLRLSEDALFLLGAVAAGGTLTALATALVPLWTTDFLAAARQYAQVPAMDSLSPAVLGLSRTLLPETAAVMATAALGAGLLAWAVLGWRAGEAEGALRSIMAGALVVPPAWETSGIMLLLPLAATLAEMRGRAAVALVAGVAALSVLLAPLSLVWPWRTGAVLAAAYVALLLVARSVRTQADRPARAARSAAAADAAVPPAPARPALR